MQTSTAIKLGAVAAVGLLGLYLVNRALTAGSAVVDAAGDALWAVSPTNNDNVIYQTVNKPVEWFTGRPGETLGGAVYEVTNDGTLNPASSNNWVYRNIRINGKPLGVWAYDVFN